MGMQQCHHHDDIMQSLGLKLKSAFCMLLEKEEKEGDLHLQLASKAVTDVPGGNLVKWCKVETMSKQSQRNLKALMRSFWPKKHRTEVTGK